MQKEYIETERLILRKFRKDDASKMFDNWANDPEVTKYMTWDAHPNVKVTKMIIDNWLEEYKKETTARYCITIKGSDEPLGSIDIVNIFDGVPEVGYCISKKYWNKGYMTEACKAFVHYLFELGYPKVCICAFKENIASNRVIQKCGLKFIKEFKMDVKNTIVDVNCYMMDK